jgi:hypothetical protein
VVVLVAAGWARTKQKSWTGLIMLAVTAFLAWRSRRHAPFFGVAALAFAGPYLLGTLSWLSSLSFGRLFLKTLLEPAAANAHAQQGEAEPFPHPDETRERRRALLLVTVYGLLAFYAVMNWLPQASFQVLAPVGHDPVREADILSLAQAKGNLATPFHWGSYSAWRLCPNIRISMDGRYEAAYPESTFLLNARFFDKTGPDWDRLIRQYPVDYVLLDLSQAGLRPEDLRERGYALIWVTEGSSALMALEKHAKHLLEVTAALPPTTIEPLDAAITDRWWAPHP